jgi:hypothetical protein
MSVSYRPRFFWPQNQLRLPDSLYLVNVAPGLSPVHLRAPRYVDIAGMTRAAQSDVQRSMGWQVGSVNGRVTRNFEPHFVDPASQWRRLPPPHGRPGTHGPCHFQFTGGEVFLDLTLGIYILNTCQPVPDQPLTIEIFSAAYSHELLHVLDEVDIVNTWLVQRLNADQELTRTLGRSEPFSHGTERQTAAEVEPNFRSYIQTYLHDHIYAIWVRESNRRGALRDTAEEYRRVDERIQELRARLSNPH